ncbi:MAG: molybdopterin converting factor [Planctomycetota bacterium]
MQILLINNHGSGFADHIDIAEGTSVSALFADKMPGRKATDYLIRVNRLPVSSDQVLQPDDRVSFTGTKIEGATAA